MIDFDISLASLLNSQKLARKFCEEHGAQAACLLLRGHVRRPEGPVLNSHVRKGVVEIRLDPFEARGAGTLCDVFSKLRRLCRTCGAHSLCIVLDPRPHGRGY